MRAQALFEAEDLVAQVQTAERGTLDLVIADDRFAVPSSPSLSSDRVWGRLDALLALARAAPLTTAVGLVPTIDVTHTEPFHVSKNVATLDLVSGGRAGWRVAVSTTEAEAGLFGRKSAAPVDELVDEADEVIDVAGRLWDSWEDDTIIRDRPTGRYIDRGKLHYVDFEGRFFNVRGPSITPRPPQGQPVVVVDAVSAPAAALAAGRADVALVVAPDAESAGQQRADLRSAAEAAGRSPDDLTVLAIVDVVLGADSAAAGADRRVLDQIVDGVVPALRAAGVFRSAYTERSLRRRFGLEHPPNRYAARATAGVER